MFYDYNIDSTLVALAQQAEQDALPHFQHIDDVCLYASAKVLKAFQNNNLATTDFFEESGYGYSDAGREKLEKIYAEIFDAEDALVRAQIMSGAHALSLTFFGLLKHGDTLLSISGEPYDSLKSIIGITGNSRNSLIANGINYQQIELIDDDFDTTAIQAALQKQYIKVLTIQRSRGYSHRKSLCIDKIEKICKLIKQLSPKTIIVVDNCYGEFVETREPTHVGADLVVGSLMKNLGGGVAKTGGYIVGKAEFINDVAERFSAPGIGKDIGANLNQLFSFFKGLYSAPSVVASSLKTMIFASRLLELLGYNVAPKYNEKRTDIIQTIQLGTREKLIAFCQGIQKGAPIESFAVPEAGFTPGYPHEEIMASGSFISGSTIELSCDGPIIPPYTAFLQGGITYEYGKLGILIALNQIIKSNN